MLNTGVANRVREASALRAVVVEDHPFQRTGVIMLLRAIGVQNVAEAGNGREALEVLQRADVPPADVVLCDLEMPEMDGIEFLRAVAEQRLARSVIIISGREAEILGSAEAMARASGLTVLGRLTKPATLEALRGLLERIPQPGEGAAKSDTPLLDAGRLRRAFEQQEFHADFQPKVSLGTGALLGVEALARWRPLDAKAIGPDAFIPAVQRAGLLTTLTEAMLDAACRALAAWKARGLTPDVAVNVSMSTLEDLHVADTFAARVRSYGIAPQRVTFEVTETELMGKPAAVLDVLTRLRLKGFRLAIDDFGTGYSSLAQLNTIPFTELKIDRSFVRDCEKSPRMRDIVLSSIELARRLKIHTVAEGIETPEAWDFLRSIQCDEAQGYYIGVPMSAAELPAWVLQRRRHLRV